MFAEIVIIEGKCLTMVEENTVEWLAVAGGKIIGIGNGQEWKSWCGADTRIISAAGKSVVPGFIDNHVHVVLTALNTASVDLSNARDFDEIGFLIQHAASQGDGNHIRGIHLEVEQLREKRPPDRIELDKYCTDVPVSLHSTDYQISALNTYGMLYFKIPFSIPGTELDQKGVPTGIFRKEANAVLYTNTLKDVSDHYRKKIVEELMNSLLRNGITSISAMEGGRMCDDMGYSADMEFLLQHQNEFPIDMEFYYPTIDLERVLDKGLSRIGGVLYLDGTIGGRTAAISFRYADDPENQGMLCMKQEDVNEFVLHCYEAGLQLSLFSLGDRAIDMALCAHEYAQKKTGIAHLRHRLEHVVLVSPEQMRRASALGLVFSMMPSYEGRWGGSDSMYARRLGEHFMRTNPLRGVLDSGIVLCGSSDSDVTEANPLQGIFWAVNHPVKEHRLSVYEALRIYTANGAYAMGREKEKGTLEIGKEADLVVLDRDILSTPAERLNELHVVATIKSGEVLYDAL